MTPALARTIYRRARASEGESIKLRRYSGSGASRTPTDYTMTALRVYRPTGDGDDLIGGLVQRDRQVIVMLEDVQASGFPLPINITSDKVVLTRESGSPELAIKDIDDDTRRVKGELIAFEMRVGG